MNDLEKRLEAVSEDLQELISITAQNADKSSVNMVVRLEAFEKKLEDQHIKRMATFKWSVGLVLVILTILTPVIFMYFDRIMSQVMVDAQRISVIETNDKDQPSNKDFLKAVTDLEKREQEIMFILKNVFTHKDAYALKIEIMEWVMKYQSNKDPGKDGPRK